MLILILLIGVVAGFFFLRPESRGDLFSQSIDTTDTDSGVPATQSLDNEPSDDVTSDRAQEIKILEEELLTTNNDPEKALEIRRRLQILRSETPKNAQ